MSTDEIRYWLVELRQRGWGSNVLGRTVGLACSHAINRKANGKEWIYSGEQYRCGRQIERILAGELVCIPGKRGGRGRIGKALIVENPVPLVPPTQWAYTLKRGLHVIDRSRPQPLRVPGSERRA